MSKESNLKPEKESLVNNKSQSGELINPLFHEAIAERVSNIHIESLKNEFVIRFRKDGVLYNKTKLSLDSGKEIIDKIRILAKLDSNEKRLPQDGYFIVRLEVDGKKKEQFIGVSVVKGNWGDNVMLAIYSSDEAGILELDKIGFEKDSFVIFQKAINQPSGIIVFTGPSFSGKSMAIASSLKQINDTGKKIITIECPIKFHINGITQLQVKENIGLTFPSLLRTVRRHDPDIIMIGEIRDYETADIAIKAALSGQLILSSMHTQDSTSTIFRFIDMGIEPYLVTSTITLVCAQRLVRKICNYCKKEIKVPKEALLDIGFNSNEADKIKIYKGQGCEHCFHTGYNGLIGLFELLQMTSSLQEKILKGKSDSELRQAAIVEGMITLRKSGLEKIRQGITTIEEVLQKTTLDS